MSFFIYNQPIGSTAKGQYVKFGKTTKQDDGTVTFSYEDGSVLSVQPNGKWETRPAGSSGDYEKATISGNTVTFNPGNGADEPFPYMFFQSLNN